MRTQIRASLVLALVALAVFAAAGCGGDSKDAGGRPDLIVSAAASLTDAFDAYGEGFEAARLRASYAGSDELAAQIRKGVKPDVFASANTKLPDELFKAGKVEKPRVFAGNRLVIAVPKDSNVKSLGNLTKPGTKLVVGSKDVPVGSYTREVLDRASAGKEILANVVSEEPDVSGVAGKLTQGAADAGFLYVTDVTATNGRLKAIELPKRLQPSVKYGIAIVKGAKHPKQAAEFIEGLISGAGREEMEKAGFEPPPG